MNLNDIIKSHKAHSTTINASAKELRNLMEECGISTLNANGCCIRVREVRANSGACHTQLEMEACDEYSMDWVCLQDEPSSTNDSYYEYGDFNCVTTRPTREQLLKYNTNSEVFVQLIKEMAVNNK